MEHLENDVVPLFSFESAEITDVERLVHEELVVLHSYPQSGLQHVVVGKRDQQHLFRSLWIHPESHSEGVELLLIDEDGLRV